MDINKVPGEFSSARQRSQHSDFSLPSSSQLGNHQYKVPPPSHQGIKDNYKNSYNSMRNSGYPIRSQWPQCVDVGPDWAQEFPNMVAGSGTWPLPPTTSAPPSSAPANVYAQSSSSQAASNTSPVQPDKVTTQYDAKGRELAPCGSLKRQKAPPPPDNPPFPIKPENVPLIEKWFLETYEASAFNTCTHQPLPLMTGLPPLRIHTKPDVIPVAIHKPSTIPDH